MAVVYRHREPPAARDLVSRLENEIGHPLPDSYRRYLLEQDGGWVADNDTALHTIFGLGDVPAVRSMWKKLKTYAGRVPPWSLPVASDVYGNLFIISLRPEEAGTVWFWDHEEEADEDEPPSEDNVELRAADWLTFLDRIGPLDD